MLKEVEWGGQGWKQYLLTDIFYMTNTKSIAQKNVISDTGIIPYVTAASGNNGVCTYIDCPVDWQDKGNCIMIGGKTLTITYQKNDFCSNDSHNIALYLKDEEQATRSHYLFMVSALRSSLKNRYSWGNSISMKKIKKESFYLPVKDGVIDYAFMERFIAELEAERVRELEAYMEATGLKDYILTPAERNVLAGGGKRPFKKFNLRDLFGRSTRGKRLKSADRVCGILPFVTAGEANAGISDFVGNDVMIFSSNTVTIDMFGSAKYRNYEYGADDHVAVVHTENVPKLASIYVTAAIHKASHDGQFSYARNFYAKDADALNIMLPEKDGRPDWCFMERVISAVQKIVVQDLVLYSERKMLAVKEVVNR